MDVIDVNCGSFREVEIKGYTALFTELCIKKDTVPAGMNCYELRHGEDDSYPTELALDAGTDYFGAVLMTDKMEIGPDVRMPIIQEDFGFTGENLSVAEYLANYGREPETFSFSAELLRFMDENGISFQMSEKEADVLFGYLEGQGYVLGEKNGQLFRGDLHYAQGRTRWTEDSIDDVVDEVCEWNYAMIQEIRNAMETDELAAYMEEKSRLNVLEEDEKILDALFDRTKYGEEIDRLAKEIVGEFIRDLNSKEGIDGAIGRMAEQIKSGKDQLPDVSPALKQGTGRRR